MSLLIINHFTYSLFSISNRYSPRQVRHFDFISQFTTDIRHVNGTDNPVADALSCIDIQEVNQLPPIFDAMAAAQVTDVELQKLWLSPTSSLKLKDIPIQGTDVSLVCDNSRDMPHPNVPPNFR